MTTKKASTKSSVKPTTPGAPTSATATAPALATPVVTLINPGTVAQCLALLSQIGTLLGPAAALSTAAIRQMLKLRKGGAQVVTDLLALCTHHGLTSVGPVTVATMTSEMDRANALNQIGVSLAALQKQLNDATLLAESTTWQSATTLYTVLQRLAVNDPTLAAGLAPIQEFFQTKRTKGLKRANAQAKELKDAQTLVKENASPAASVSTVSTASVNGASGVTGVPSAPVAASGSSGPNGAAHS